MFDLSSKTRAHLAKSASITVRILVGGLIVLNVVFLLPGTYFAIHEGTATPIVTAVILSLMVWAAGYGIYRLLKARVRRAFDEASARNR